jgi:hypothetical protein
MPSSDQASQISRPCTARASGGGGRPCCDVARGGGQLIFDRAKSPAALLARGLQKYDNRIVPFRSLQGATLWERGEVGPCFISSVRIRVNAR